MGAGAGAGAWRCGLVSRASLVATVMLCVGGANGEGTGGTEMAGSETSEKERGE